MTVSICWFILHALVQCLFVSLLLVCSRNQFFLSLCNPEFLRKLSLNLSSPLIHSQGLLPSSFCV